MNDSNGVDHLETKHEHIRESRIEAIKRWVECVKTNPVETWGPQQNAIVNSQLEAAQHVHTTAAHKEHVKAVAKDIIDASDDSNVETE